MNEDPPEVIISAEADGKRIIRGHPLAVAQYMAEYDHRLEQLRRGNTATSDAPQGQTVAPRAIKDYKSLGAADVPSVDSLVEMLAKAPEHSVLSLIRRIYGESREARDNLSVYQTLSERAKQARQIIAEQTGGRWESKRDSSRNLTYTLVPNSQKQTTAEAWRKPKQE